MFNFGFAGALAKPFGIDIKTKAKQEEEKIINKQAIIAVDADDPAYLIDAFHNVQHGMDIATGMQSQAQMINDYRAAALHHDVDSAVDDVVNAMVSSDEDEDPISIDLENLEMSDGLKDKIIEEFDFVTKVLLDFNNTAYEKTRQFYVDGRQAFHVVVDPNNTKKGILKLTNLDPRSIRQVKEVAKVINPKTGIEEIKKVDPYYVYNTTYVHQQGVDPTGMGVSTSARNSRATTTHGQTLKLTEDSVCFVHCGIVCPDTGLVLSPLAKALRPLNQLRHVEDSIVIYRTSRATERRAFYIDVGSLPRKSAEEYVRNVMDKYRTKLTYDARLGKVIGKNHQVSLLEDYWLPRKEGSRGTEISTIEGGQNLGQLDDLYYLKKNLYEALNVPKSRVEQDAQILIGGRGAEISRDEWKFSKFIARMRRKYAGLFLELLRRQLILKGITTDEDWKEFVLPFINVTFASDSYMKDQQETDALESKIRTLSEVAPYVGRYFSDEWVKRNVLKQDDEEIKNQRKQIDDEIKKGLIRDPMADPEEEEGGGNNPFA